MSDDEPMPPPLDGGTILERAPRVRALVERLRASGVALEGCWVVGGAVRDAVLGRDAGPDIDVAVEGPSVAFAHLLASATGGEVVAEHEFGTATVLVNLAHPWGLVEVDVATCRTERYLEPGALPTVTMNATIEVDLARRDVTANAVAVALEADVGGVHRVADPQGGLRDIEAHVLRILHDDSFHDDPTRIVRLARYAGRLGFRVDDHTRRLAMAAVEGGALATVSAQRLRSELELVLREPAWEALTLLASWGVVERLDPRLEAAFHPPLLLAALDQACGSDAGRHQRAWPLRLTALTRPLGDDAAGWMRWLGFPAHVVDSVSDHLSLLNAVGARPDELRAMPNSELYLELGEVADESIALAALLLDEDPMLLERLLAFAAALRSTRLHIRGDDVLAAGVPAGPRVGRILGQLFLRALDGELHGEAQERQALAELAAEAGTDLRGLP